MAVFFELIPGKKVGYEQPCFIIAEIGQNHQGDLNIAKELIKVAQACGADCVKFQKSDLKSRFNKNALKRPYDSSNSWGNTYGEHREHLEFSKKDFKILQDHAKNLNIPFIASGMDKVSVDFLNRIGIPFFKIGSGDANNLPLIEHVAMIGKPLIISTGMQEIATVREIYESVTKLNPSLCLLQCTSSYPTQCEDVNLNVIKTYIKEFPKAVIGYSGHERGIGISIAAVTLGAKILERHLTLNCSWKGSDHIASLEPMEFKKMVMEIRNVEKALGSCRKTRLQCEIPCYDKLGKTVVATRYLPSGTILEKDMLDIKVSEPKGWKAENIHDLIGKKLKNSVDEDCSILSHCILE